MSIDEPFSKPYHMIFGGTFDPPHQGHHDLINSVQKIFKNASFSVIPNGAPPKTVAYSKQPSLSFQKRLLLTQQLFSNMPNVFVSDIEAPKGDSLHYTYGTLKTLATDQQPLALLMGSDQYRSFFSWARFKDIIELADIIVISRGPQAKSQRRLEDSTRALFSHLGQPFNQDEYPVYKVQCTPRTAAIYILEHPPICNVSSSNIRDLQQKNQEIPSHWLNPKVHALYMKYSKETSQ